MNALLCLLTGLLAVLGRIFGQALGARRELDGRNRQLRVQFLVEAWRSIERALEHPGPDELRGLEQALADIQLFGTPSQADRAARVARSMNTSAMDSSDLDELLSALRLELRQEMRLGLAVAPLAYVRADRTSTAPRPVVSSIHRRPSRVTAVRRPAAA